LDFYQLIVIGVIGTILPLGILKLCLQQGESFNIQAKKVESNDFMFLTFIFSYILPFCQKVADYSNYSIMVIIIGLGLVLNLVNALPMHPILLIFQFRFYKIESSAGMSYILISKKKIRDPRDVMRVKRLSSSMLVEDMTHV
jgi:hypothetical protein